MLLMAATGGSSTPPVNPSFARWRDALTRIDTEPVVIACAGDSLTDMDAASIDGNGWTPRLARLLRDDYGPTTFYDVGAVPLDTTPTSPGMHVVNVAQSGATSYNYLANPRGQNVITARPHLVTHMIGMNNYSFTSTTPASIAADIGGRMDAIDAAVSTLPVHVVMIEPRKVPADEDEPFTWAAYRLALEGLVQSRPAQAVIVDIDGAFGDTDGLRAPDGIHLNTNGYELVSTTMYAALTG